MAEKIQAYFKSENDAANAAAKLEKVNVMNMLVDKIPDGKGLGNVVLVPAVNMGAAGGTGVGAPAPGGGASPMPAPGILSGKVGKLSEMGENNEESSSGFTHIIECDVEEDEKKEALDVLRQTEAYIDEIIIGDK